MIRVTLESLDGDEPPFVLEAARLTIGRGIRAVRDEEPAEALLDIDARHVAVSREHARLRRDGDAVLVENLGKHGTKVNGEAVRAPRALADGDVLQFGDDGPRFRARLTSFEDNKAVRRCSGCREILPVEDLERHEEACEALRPRQRRKQAEAPTFHFGPLRSTKRTFLILADLSGGPEGKGSELWLTAPGVIDALRAPGLQFGLLGFGAGSLDIWRGPAKRLHTVSAESRDEAKAWLRERTKAKTPATSSLGDALKKAQDFLGLESVIVLTSTGTKEIAFQAKLEVQAVGLGPLYFADSEAQACLRELAARHGGHFLAVAARE